jgi:hypothetical protein
MGCETCDKLREWIKEFVRAAGVMNCDCEGGYAERGLVSPSCHKHQYDIDPAVLEAAKEYLGESHAEDPPAT